MAKILIHVGLHKTGSSHLQRFLYSNTNELSERSLEYLRCWLKEGIRSYVLKRKRRAIRFRLRNNTIQPWYSYYPDTRFIKKALHDHAILSKEALSKLLTHRDDVLSLDHFFKMVCRSYISNHLARDKWAYNLTNIASDQGR